MHIRSDERKWYFFLLFCVKSIELDHFFLINTILLVKKGNFISTKLLIIYISLYSLNDQERSGKNFKTINHFPNQPLKMEIFRYFEISPLSTEFEEHLFVFFSTLIITLINTVFLLLQLFGCFLQQHPLCLHSE